MRTKAELVRWATKHIASHRKGGVSEARATARAIAQAVEPAQAQASLGHAHTWSEHTHAAFTRAARAHAASGTPVQYLACQAQESTWPWHCIPGLRIRPPILCPRPETEALVDLAHAGLHKHAADDAQQPLHIVDAGCGSGAIGIALALLLPQLHVLSIDVHPAAVKWTRVNAERAGVQHRLLAAHLPAHLLDSATSAQLCASWPAWQGKFDAIVSNPPYIPAREHGGLPSTVRLHEHPLALAAGPDGLAVIRTLLGVAADMLLPGGSLLMETDSSHPSVLAAAASAAGQLHPDAQQAIHARDVHAVTGLPAPETCAWWPAAGMEANVADVPWPSGLALVGAWSDGQHDRFVQCIRA